MYLLVYSQSVMYEYRLLLLNNNLTWDTHIEHTSLKISIIIFTINRLKHIYPQHILHNIYKSIELVWILDFK